MSASLIISLVLGYLLLLFALAYFIEKRAQKGKRLLKSPLVYALSLAVYCTAWTYYGSVGKAVSDGLTFLTIYIGPIVVIPLWWIIVRKMVRICNLERISTLADFISSRYGKSVFLSVLVTILAVIGVIPYISIQLKSISNAFDILAYQEALVPSRFIVNDSAFYLTIILAVFIILFAFRTADTTDKHEGMVGAIAFESIIKLFAFLAVGIYVTYGIFDGFQDVFAKANAQQLEKFQQMKPGSGFEWFFMIVLSMSAVILMPRQFQVAVAENVSEKHIKTAAWLFPAYLLVINIFVIPIALGGQLKLGDTMDPDSYVLGLPLSGGQQGLALFTFLGGFSAATSMIIVSTIALSIMVSNNMIVPLSLKNREDKRAFSIYPLQTRRMAVFAILLMAYVYFRYVSERFSIVSIGLISFAAILQFAPAVVGALFWKDANKMGAIFGILAGFAVWFYTLVLPTIVEVGFFPQSIMTFGPFGITLLIPDRLFGMSMDPIAAGSFWSLLANIVLFASGSLLLEQSPKERNIAEYYVDIFKHSKDGEDRIIWKGQLLYRDLVDTAQKLLGKERTLKSIVYYEENFGAVMDKDKQLKSSFVNYMERVISGVVGAASARMIISSVSSEEEIELGDVVKILKESTETSRLNKQLQLKSYQLQAQTEALEKANERLKNLDYEKDDFISTVSHELRTPLTSIKAFVEILLDNKDIPEEEKDRFLNVVIKETDRMTRLINQVLDLEKLHTGTIEINSQEIMVREIIDDAITSVTQLLKEKEVKLVKDFLDERIYVEGDADRLQQVFINLLGNAIKFVSEESGEIEFKMERRGETVLVMCSDNGKGIAGEDLERIFDKFYQVRDQARKKPKGTGLGLAISKKIIELHGGTIEVESKPNEGATFHVNLPIFKIEKKYEPVG